LFFCSFRDLADFSACLSFRIPGHCLFPYCFWPLNKVAKIVAVRTRTG
jgi:hypothetical protein